ncbi:MAG: conserved rane protein of unknown function [Blastococcus sp.]|jgi:hypothetical protein|nr:conserved rane protein of unknown function [Blastococcus sp.]
MAEQGTGESTSGTDAVVGPTGGRPAAPRVFPWLLVYTIGRLGILAALVLLLWTAGLARDPGLLFGLLLSMPVSYLLLRPSRERLSEALAARSVKRRAAKDDLRARLSGSE